MRGRGRRAWISCLRCPCSLEIGLCDCRGGSPPTSSRLYENVHERKCRSTCPMPRAVVGAVSRKRCDYAGRWIPNDRNRVPATPECNIKWTLPNEFVWKCPKTAGKGKSRFPAGTEARVLAWVEQPSKPGNKERGSLPRCPWSRYPSELGIPWPWAPAVAGCDLGWKA